MANFKPAKIEKQETRPFSELLGLFVAVNRLGPGLYRKAVFKAWDDASGAGNYTLKRFFRDGKLYITLSSSVIRGQLSVRKTFLLEKVNAVLADDPMMIRNDTYPQVVTELILK